MTDGIAFSIDHDREAGRFVIDDEALLAQLKDAVDHFSQQVHGDGVGVMRSGSNFVLVRRPEERGGTVVMIDGNGGVTVGLNRIRGSGRINLSIDGLLLANHSARHVEEGDRPDMTDLRSLAGWFERIAAATVARGRIDQDGEARRLDRHLAIIRAAAAQIERSPAMILFDRGTTDPHTVSIVHGSGPTWRQHDATPAYAAMLDADFARHGVVACRGKGKHHFIFREERILDLMSEPPVDTLEILRTIGREGFDPASMFREVG